MSRKTSANLKDAPVKLDKTAQAFIRQARSRKPYAGAERQWAAYIEAIVSQEEQSTRLDAISKLVEKDGGDSSSGHWDAFQVHLKAYDHAWRLTLAKLDAYDRTVQHIKHAVVALRGDVVSMANDSLIERLANLQLSLDLGILCEQIADVVFPHIAEGGDVGTPAFCGDCG